MTTLFNVLTSSTKLYLIRHAETDWNIEDRLQGHIDVPLNSRGRQQAIALASWLQCQDIQALYTSDLIRARETADIISSKIAVPPLLDKRLREINAGLWSGYYKSELIQNHKSDWINWRRGISAPENGETYLNLQKRAMKVIIEVCKNRSGERVAFITHAGVIRVILAYVTDNSITKLEKNIVLPTASTSIIKHCSKKTFLVKDIGYVGYL